MCHLPAMSVVILIFIVIMMMMLMLMDGILGDNVSSE